MDISFFLRQAYQAAPRFGAGRPAVSMEGEPALTFDEIAGRANSYSNALLGFGVKHGDRIGILMHNTAEYWIAYFATTRIGAIAVRLNFRLSADELEYAITDSGAIVILGHDELLKRLEDRRERLGAKFYVGLGDGTEPHDWAVPWSELEAGAPTDPPVPLPKAEDGAMIMYTSGTTGRPKGALWTHGTTTWWVAQQIMEWGYTQDSVTMVTGPLYHIGALENYTLPTLAAGGRVVMMRSKNFDIVRALEIASAQKVTDLLLFPTMISEMLQKPECAEIDLSSVTRVYTGGDAVLPWAVQTMREKYPHMDLVQVYGLTEGTPIVACGERGFAFDRPEFVGRAFPFSEFSIRDDDGTPVAEGVPGEIWTRSPANSTEYWGKPEASAETFVEGWCRTGDLGYVQDGALRISGRKKDVIRSGGENIYPAEIEDVLLRHPAIRDAAVIGLPDNKFIETVCAVVVVAAGMTITEGEVIDHCRTHLASYKKPTKVFFTDEIPRTASQKIQKFVLRDRYSTAS